MLLLHFLSTYGPMPQDGKSLLPKYLDGYAEDAIERIDMMLSAIVVQLYDFEPIEKSSDSLQPDQDSSPDV